MPILQARIETERPSRYLVQFCKHASAMGSGGHSSRTHLHGMVARRDVQVQAEWSDTHGTVTFTPWGQCTIIADPSTLTLRIEASDEDGMRQIQDIITRDFERFSRRDPLTVTWRQPDGTPRHEADETTPAPRRDATTWVRANLQTTVITVAVLLVVSLHLGLAGAIGADSRWTGVATNAVLAIVVLKVTLIAIHIAMRHRKNNKMSDET